MKKPLLFAVVLAAAVAAFARRRQSHADADHLWREATSDASR